MRRVQMLAAALVLAAAPAGAGADVTVEVGHNHLSPAEVSIGVGETVTFHNRDAMPGGHTIAADDGSFSSPALEKDESWSRAFDEPGSYPYHIKEHPDARGEIRVE